MKHLLLATALSAAALVTAAQAETAVTVPFDGSFDDATFAVESAIVDRGLVIDFVSHVGDMLNRTGADVGSDAALFEAADIFVFCSAVLSREVMEADPMNIAFCPYGIFVADQGDGVVVGYRTYPEGEMKKVETLLAEIVADAVED
ncbi:uncharacterized protein (DUF302 family) [Litoreibacter ponti]|uniref:Uncharacterized protein (DUF302 family) n=1 Tax=Litoreibacter ponti TaxID=1510457 RepID=A0A2T6BEJ6_9RHOB|nr:DUF302 domain-containing protein [Litoreibacter ponti]PTX54478.1 uncharacterized protein (DUF302 family) [Litoreibacter ponti]